MKFEFYKQEQPIPDTIILKETRWTPLWVAAQRSSDPDLLDRIARGDKLAKQALFARHNVQVYRFMLRLVGEATLAEDLLSEVFTEVSRQAAKFEGRSAVSTWLLAIARFKALSSIRRGSEEELDEDAAAAIEDPGDDPEVPAQKKDRGENLRRCIADLPPEDREIIDLVYYHEKSIEDIAEIVGIPVNTVKTRMLYVRKRLCELSQRAGIDRTYQ